jgi:spore germination protein KB
MDLENLTPVLENGIVPVAYGALVIASRTTVILAVLMLLPYINMPKKIKNYLGIGFLTLTLYFIAIAIITAAIFGVEQAKTLAFPFYYAVRMISIADFLERIDAIFFAIWVLGMFVNIATIYYLTVLAAAQLLKLRNYGPIVLAMGTIIVSLSIFQSDSMIALNEFLSYKVFTWYALFFIFVLPLFLLIVAIIRKKGADSR